MLHVHGQPLPEPEIRRLIELLSADGGPDAREAARVILNACAGDRFAAALSFDTRDAIYFVLSTAEDLPDGLAKLKETLGRGILALLQI